MPSGGAMMASATPGAQAWDAKELCRASCHADCNSKNSAAHRIGSQKGGKGMAMGIEWWEGGEEVRC